MPIKNYTTVVPANRSISELHDALVSHGATAFMMKYEKDTGRIDAITFGLLVEGNEIGFKLPVGWRSFQAVLKKQGVRRWDDEDYVYRVSWRCIRDWVLAQLALYETQIVQLPQVFLPFATGKGGKTIYEQVIGGQLLLT